jgi:hypothetical protein
LTGGGDRRNMTDDNVDVGAVFDVLRHRHRRRVLVALERERPGGRRADVFDLGEEIATEDDADEVRVRLVHCHLPKLADHGFVEWDRDDGTVTRGPRWGVIEPYLALLADPEDRA